jgi:hypothetical protein
MYTRVIDSKPEHLSVEACRKPIYYPPWMEEEALSVLAKLTPL